MKPIFRLLNIIVILTLVVTVFGTAAAPPAPSAAVHPLLAQLAAAKPDQIVSVIVQKAARETELAGQVTRLGGKVTRELSIINAFTAEMTARNALQLALLPDVRWISLDAAMVDTGRITGTCPVNTNFYPDTTLARIAWKAGITGAGIGVAVIDSGISPDKDLTLGATVSFNPNSKNVLDVQGHGTHVAGIIGGNGSESNGQYVGIAPGVTLLGLKVSDETGLSYESDVVAAMQWVLENKSRYNIRVVNMSLNSSVEQSYHNSPINAAAEILWFNGIVVVVSAGNAGMGYNTINAAPANDPFVITVGALDEKCTSDPADDVMGTFSMYGVTQDGYAKPDILAPGYNMVSVLSNNSSWGSQYPDRVAGNGQYFRLSGTSMSAPVVSGAIALLLQYRPDLTPDQVKYILKTYGGTVKLDRLTSFKSVRVDPSLLTGSIPSANTNIPVSQLLTSGSEPVNSTVSWNSVSWNSVSWNSVSWNSVAWNSVSWNSVAWNSVFWGK